jgi:tetratricopeptide (TPR) repeat protein
MVVAWLQLSASGVLGPLTAWPELGPNAGLGIAAGVLVAAAALAWLVAARRRRRTAAARLQKAKDEAAALKAELRRRLAETEGLLANGGAPTMGVNEAFESDIEAAARTVLTEAGGQRGKARELLRRRVDGHRAADDKLNGSEAHYWRQLGALSLLDGPADALAAYTRAADLAPGDPEARMLVGVLHLRAGNLAAAEAAFRRQIEITSGGGGGVARYRGRTMLGDVHAARGEHNAALEAYSDAQHEVVELLERSPREVGLKRDLSVTWDRMGDVRAAMQEDDAALACYRRSLEIAEALVKAAPENAVWQRDLSVSHDRIGEVLDRQGDRQGALDSFSKGLGIAEALTLRDPDNLQWQWDLSASYDRIGDVLIAEGRRVEARKTYGRGLTVAEALAKRDPGNAAWQRDLAVSYHKIGSIEALDDPAEAREHLVRGRAIIDRLARIAARQAQWRSDLSQFDETLRSLDG